MPRWKPRGLCGSLTHATGYLVIGIYATDSWAHSLPHVIGCCGARTGGPVLPVHRRHRGNVLARLHSLLVPRVR
jgi:hypothetical protein